MSLIITLSVLAVTLIANLTLLFTTVTLHKVKDRVAGVFILHLAGVVGWSLFLLLLLSYSYLMGFPEYKAGDGGYLIGKFVFLFATILFSTNYWFVHFFIGNKFKFGVSSILFLILQTTAILLSLFDNALYTSFSVVTEGYISVVIAPLNAVYSIFLLAHLLAPLILLSIYGRKENDVSKTKQYKILFNSYAIFLVASMTFNWVLPVYLNIYNFNALGPTTSLILVFGIIYAMARYSFLDIKIIIQRGTIYTALLVFITSVYLLLLSLLGTIISDERFGVATAGFLATLIGVFSVPRLDAYLREKTDKIFFKGRYNYAEVLSALSGVLNKNVSEKTIIKKTSNILEEALKSESVAFSFDGKFNTDSGLVLPINSANKKIGQIKLGSKRSGQPYTEEDISLLTTFTNQAGVALEKARLFDEVKDYASTLEKKVEERTAEIVTLHKEQESMMHEISHGLQTPLTIMKGELYLLKKQGYETDKIDSIDGSINRISYFINKLLALYRLETAPAIKPKKVALKVMLSSIVFSFAELFQKNNFTYTLDAEKEVLVTGDADALDEVVSNLINNAIKYSKPGVPNHLAISLKADKNQVIIKLSDTGIGVSKENISKLFTKFYRVRGAETKNVQGTGLGLAICHKVIERHGGSIEVESELGVGTTFIIRLPKKPL